MGHRERPRALSDSWSKIVEDWFPQGITSLTIDIPSSNISKASPSSELPPSRWRTKEFYAYYAVFLVVVPSMAKVAMKLSSASHPNYIHFVHRLRPGWLLGWQVDTSDHQWYTFRSNLPLLGIIAALHLLLSHLSSAHSRTASRRESIILAFAFPLLLALHGTSLPKMLIILTANYQVATRAPPLVGWGFNLAILFANEIWEGYKWETISSSLAFLDEGWLRGVLPRWHINWNITMLRLISFNMDYHWANTSRPVPPPSSEKPQALALDERTRATTSHPLSAYTFSSYLAYALYPPLYLAGPIMTYNAFRSQLASPPLITRKQVTSYAVRFAACLLTMEFVGHTMYVVAIKDSSRSGAWFGDTPFELSMIGFWNLIIVWLKLLILWRFFRLWALLDNVDPPENMVRCMANNYSTSGFWRSWHRSYNLWIVRYIYVPIGGASNAFFATLVVFTFVALWHDLSLKLLTWGWAVTLFVLPEMAGKKFVPVSKYGSAWWYRHVAALGGVFNILLMLTANLIGFAIGMDGTSYMWSQIIGSWQERRRGVEEFPGGADML